MREGNRANKGRYYIVAKVPADMYWNEYDMYVYSFSPKSLPKFFAQINLSANCRSKHAVKQHC